MSSDLHIWAVVWVAGYPHEHTNLHMNKFTLQCAQCVLHKRAYSSQKQGGCWGDSSAVQSTHCSSRTWWCSSEHHLEGPCNSSSRVGRVMPPSDLWHKYTYTQILKTTLECKERAGSVMHAFNSNSREVKASLVYIVSSKTIRATK